MTDTTIAPILVSILLLSVVTAGTAVSTTASVGHDGGELHHDAYTYDANLSTGGVHWQGQELYLQGNTSDAEYDLHEVEGSGTNRVVGNFVRTVSLDEQASLVLETESLDAGEYVLLDENDRLVQTNENGVEVRTASQNDGEAITQSRIHIVEQNLSVDTDRESAVVGGQFEFTLDSNRGAYAVEITAGGLTSEELQQVFGGTETDAGTRVTITDGLLEGDFSDIDTGDYTFTFDVTDVDTESTTTVGVSDPADMQLRAGTVQSAVGDTVTINLTMQPGDSGQLVVGSTDKAYRAKIGFKDDDRDGYVSLSMNTYLVGNHTGSGEQQAWTAADGDVIMDVELTTDSLDEPLEPAGYNLEVRNDREQADIGLLVLSEASISELTLQTAPGTQFGEAWDETTRTQTDTVAVDDVVIAAVTAPGLFGLYETQPGDDATERFRSLVESENASFSLQADQRGNTEPELDTDASFENDAFHVIAEPENDTLYVTMDEESLRYTAGRNTAQPDDQYQVSFELHEQSDVVSSNQTVSSTVQFTDRSVSIDTGEGDQLWLSAASDEAIAGSTTVAPGTDLDFRVSVDGLIRELLSTTVDSNRTFRTAVNLSDAEPGANVSVGVREYEAEARGIIQATATEPTDPTGPTDPATPSTDTAVTTESPADGTETTTSNPTSETPDSSTATEANASDDLTEITSRTTSEDGPGFSVGVALLALAGFVLLGRRQWAA